MSSNDEQAVKIRVCRAYKGWKQGDLARKTRIDPSALSRYEREGGAPSAVMERIHGATEVPPVLADVFISSCQALQAQADRSVGSESGHAQDLASEVASRFAALLAPAFVAMSAPDGQPPVQDSPPTAADRAEAERLFQRLAPLSQDDRLVVVAKGRQYRSAALCERLCDESENVAARNANDARLWAELALLGAERIPGSEAKRAKGLGYTWAFVGNSRRVANEFSAVDAAFARSRTLYAIGREGAPGWFDEARALDLEASFRRDEGKFSEALELVEQALAICGPSSRSRILLKQAATYEQSGDSAGALAALREAQPAIERGEGGPRFLWMLRFNLANNLLRLGRPTEANGLLPELHPLAAELNNDLDSLRLRWLDAAIQADLGQRTKALAEMAAVRAEFDALKLPADAALVGLHEAVILLEDLRTAKVRTLVRTMKPIFDSLGLKREALAGYRLFVAAVEREAATATMARELAKAIERAGKRMGGPAEG